MRYMVLILGCLLLGANAEVVDTIVALAGSTAIKRSDVLQDLRLTAFLNKERPDFGTAAQLQAVNRLVDQAIIREEVQAGMYAMGEEQAAEKILTQLREERGGPGAFQEALRDYGISEAALRQRLEWQIAAGQFMQVRFGAEGATSSEDQFFDWLDQRRRQSRIEIREERLK